VKIQQLEQMYKEGIQRLKGQMGKQEKERLEAARVQALKEQKQMYEQKLWDVQNARKRERRLVREELIRITERANALKNRVDELLNQREEESFGETP